MIGTSTSTISPVGTLIFTLTLGFTPAGIVVGISPTSIISHPGSFGRSICPFTSSGVIGVPCGTTICLTFGVTMTGTSTVILRSSGNSISTGTTGFVPGVVVVGISPTFVTFHPFGNSICFWTSSGVTGVPTGTTTGVPFGVTITGMFIVTRIPFGNSISTGILGLSPGISVVGLSPILITFTPFGMCFSTSSAVIGSPCFLTISSIGVTFTGISTVTTLPFGNVIVTFTGVFSPGVVKSGKSPTLAVAPSGIFRPLV